MIEDGIMDKAKGIKRNATNGKEVAFNNPVKEMKFLSNQNGHLFPFIFDQYESSFAKGELLNDIISCTIGSLRIAYTTFQSESRLN